MPSHYATLEDWISREAISFSLASSESLNPAIDRVIAALGDSVELLGFGEALHGGEEILLLRNRLFQRFVEKHGYTTIAVESSFPRGRLVNEYIGGEVPSATAAAATYDDVQELGFSHNFGRLAANRELIEWMRAYNADPRHSTKLRFYGFDSPTEMVGTDSPRQLLTFALDYLTSLDPAAGQARRQRIESLLGNDADWENPAASFDPAKSIGSSPAATALRIETEDLVTELALRRPEFIAKTDERRYAEAAHYASSARHLLKYHASLARPSENRIAELLGIRDLMMADNLAYMVAYERGRGRVLAFAHNTHLQRGMAQWQFGPTLLTWWPAGAQMHHRLGPRYAVIGTGIGVSAANGIAPPEPDTLEARLTAAGASDILIPTHRGEGLPAAAIATLPTRSASTTNTTYFPLTPRSIADFDWLAVINSTTYQREVVAPV